MADGGSPWGTECARHWLKVRSSSWLLGPVAVGLFVRCYGLLHQVVGGDELHTLRAALTMPLGRILVTYRPSDNCIPLTALSRLLMNLGLELSEIHLRLPILVSGILVLIVIPRWIASRVGLPPARVLAWLLAVSPMMVHYSRMIRSYMPIVLFGAGAIIAFEHWSRTGSRKSAAAYVLLGASAIYFHLGAFPLVMSPFVFYAGAKLLGRPAGLPPWRSATLLGIAIAGACLLFLVPARSSLISLIGLKNQPLAVSLGTIRGVAAMFSGTGVAALVILFWLAALSGLVALWRRNPAFTCYGLVLVAGQLIGLLILSPQGMWQPPIFARYLLIVLPIFLSWVAAGLTLPWHSGTATRGRRLQAALAAGFVVAVTLAGPLVDQLYRSSPFAVQPESLLFFRERSAPGLPLPAAYHRLDPAKPGPIIEYPWHTTWRYSRALLHYHAAHGREVIVAPAERLLWKPRLGFRNMIAPRPAEILESRAAYLVVHLDPLMEDRRIEGRQRTSSMDPGTLKDLEIRERDLEKFGRQAKKRARHFTQLWGPPDHGSPKIRVWDLNRLRQERGR